MCEIVFFEVNYIKCGKLASSLRLRENTEWIFLFAEPQKNGTSELDADFKSRVRVRVGILGGCGANGEESRTTACLTAERLLLLFVRGVSIVGHESQRVFLHLRLCLTLLLLDACKVVRKKEGPGGKEGGKGGGQRKPRENP